MSTENHIDSIRGFNYVKKHFNQILASYKNQNQIDDRNISLDNNLILYGPKDHGKTFMANCLFRELEKLEYEVVEVIPELKDDRENEICDHEWKAVLSSNTVCSEMSELENCLDNIICKGDVDSFEERVCFFFDDLEKYISDEKDQLREDVDNLFQYISRLQSSCKNYIVVGICNSESIPDTWPYFGIFENRLHIEDTSFNDRKEIITHLLSEIDYGKVNIDDITSMISGEYTYKKLRTLIKNAELISVNESYNPTMKISEEEKATYFIVEAFNDMEFGVDMIDFNGSKDDIMETAIHEAGHAVVGHFLNPGSVSFISISRVGRNDSDADGSIYYECKLNALDRICRCLGPIASVELKLHSHAFGTTGDITRAVILSEHLVKDLAHCGLSLVSTGLDNVTQELSKNQEVAIHNLLQEQYIRAKMIVQTNLTLLDFITNELLRKGYIFKSEILKFCEEHSIKTIGEDNVFADSFFNKDSNRLFREQETHRA